MNKIKSTVKKILPAPVLNVYKNNSLRKKCIERAMRKRGWSKEKAISEINACIERTGASYKQYLDFNLYNIPDYMQTTVYRRGLENEKLDAEKERQYIRDVAEDAGWTYEYAEEQMRKFCEENNCDMREYAYNAYHKQKERVIDILHDKHVKKYDDKKVRRKNTLEEALTKTMEYLNCSRDEAFAVYLDARARTMCQPIEYLNYEFWKMDKETQNSIFCQSFSNKIRKILNDDFQWYRIFLSKRKTNIKFKKYTRRAWIDNDKMTLEEFKETFKNTNKIFYKPNNSFGGKGAQPFDLTADNMEEVYEELKSMPRGIVEEFVIQHHKMSEMSPTAVNTIRLATMSSDIDLDEEGNHFKIAYAMLKMGGKTGNVDNLHGGGVGAAIDLETGKLCTDAVDDDARHTFEYHPVTGMKIKGFEIPYFKEACEMIKELVVENDIHGYLAWDIAIAEDGPMLIEINGDPGSTLLDLPYVGTTGKGRRQYMTDLVKHFCEIY